MSSQIRIKRVLSLGSIFLVGILLLIGLPAMAQTAGTPPAGPAASTASPGAGPGVGEKLPYQDPALPLDQRVKDLVGRMTLPEKVSQMLSGAPAIPRLGIPAYNWWNEGLHGVARAGVATIFPQAIGLAATWNPELMHSVASVISDEARAKYNEAIRHDDHRQYYGLTFWSPNINIFRDPRWGRGQETYGEDPYLTGRMGVAFVRGMQGDDPRYLKVVSTLKHFAVHSGPEPARHGFDARISDRDLRETYLVAFRTGVVDGKVDSVMGAYNALDGVPCCADPRLLTQILREEWVFDGYVVSDCDAVADVFFGHHYTKSLPEAAAASVKAGCELNCGGSYRTLVQAVNNGLIPETEIDRAVQRLFTARFRLGMFDPPEMVPYNRIPFSDNDSAAHRALALRTARESMVLLKNAGGVLPLRKNLHSVAVIGPNADSMDVLLGNYNGTPSKAVTPLAGIRAKLEPAVQVMYAKGSDLTKADPALLAAAVAAARSADASVLVLGISPRLEGEEMGVHLEGFSGGDRTSLDLPKAQQDLLEAVAAAGKPLALVLMSGSALSVNWAAAHVPAILETWYPGEEGGTALADVLFGDYNPAGRLPITFYRSVNDLPPFDDYSMKGRTYRYFTGTPLYPFGYGLSYTRFRYSGLTLDPQSGMTRRPGRRATSAELHTGRGLKVNVDVQNVGRRAGDEVVELYLKNLHPSVPEPIRFLAGVQRITLRPGERQRVMFSIDPRQFTLVLDNGQRVEEPGDFELSVGGAQPGSPGARVLTRRFRVTGPAMPFAP